MRPRAVASIAMLLLLLLLPAFTSSNPLVNPVRWAVRALTGGREPAHVLRESLLNVIGRPGNSEYTLRAVGKQNRLQETKATHETFPCSIDLVQASDPPPTSVHRLRPADVKVVAALGDSLTAGNGALSTSVLQVFAENRGVVWSIGGQGTWREFLTLPNILREFNPGLVGASLGDGLSHERGAQFNVADSLAVSSDMPIMARVLVKRIRADPRVDFYRDWKVVTLLVGGNDMCQLTCQEPGPSVWERHATALRQTLDYLQRNLPRTFVNLVMVPDASVYSRIQARPLVCDIVNYFECPCQFSPSRGLASYFFQEAIRRMQKVEEELVYSGRYDVTDDFTVVLQSFSRNVSFPFVPEGGKNLEQQITDLSYLSHDCFHFSQKGYAWAANALWNNMLEPVGSKNEKFEDAFTRFLCPTPERPYFFTSRNSNVTHSS